MALSRRKTRAIEPGIRITKYGYETYTKAGGRFQSKRWPADTPLEELRLWLETYRDVPKKEKAVPGTLADDIEKYLAARAAMPSLADRKREMAVWLLQLGTDPKGRPRRRTSITSLEIQTLRDRWLTVGPRLVQKTVGGRTRWVEVAKPLSPSAVNHRLRALSNFFRVMAPHLPNPVKDVPEVQEHQAVPKAVTYDVLKQILAKMPNRSRRLKGERYKNREAVSLAKARVAVLIWTGLNPKELQRVTPQDVDLERQLLIVPPRRKGAGAPGRIIPLAQVPEGMKALQHLLKQQALGPFNPGVVRRAWQRAAREAGYPGLNLLTVRHSFVTGVLGATKDFRQAQLLAGHRDPRTTDRYALAAILPTLEAGMGMFGKQARKRKRRNITKK